MSKIKSEYGGLRSDLILNKNDLINSNPGAVASGSNSSGNGRSSMASDNGSDDSGRGKQGKSGRRRKANRACSHCQKAHLTCDDARPCERCVKKGLADTCTDGARKKAKYLLDEAELLELKREKARKANGVAPRQESVKSVKNESEESRNCTATPTATEWATPTPNRPHMSPSRLAQFGRNTTLAPPSMAESDPNLPEEIKNNLLPGSEASDLYGALSGFSPSSQHVFGNETTSLEYSILSSMLNGIDPAWLSGSSDGTQGGENSIGSVLGADRSNNGPFSHMGIDGMPWQLNTEEVSPWKESSQAHNGENLVEPLHHMEPPVSANENIDRVAAFDALEVPSPEEAATVKHTPGMESKSQNGPPDLSRSTMVGIAKVHGDTNRDNEKRAAAAIAAATGQDKKPDAIWRERVKHIYGDQMKPFRYTEGYHFLIKYVTANLEKTQVLRIVRALAIFRPSLIALQMPLTEEDEIFVERSIQRTMLEFEKLISFSGTPTVVWRRTCEIVVVGAEFSMLTQWSKDYLRGRYIYEFFDKPSILEYWEKFASHAFENTAQSIHMQVTLKTSTGNSVKCSACFSIKRDVFDLPSLIVGNFLPILS